MGRKYGFVYIWHDKKHKRYYIGAHWGHIDDGYICSSKRMAKEQKRRPNDFKRRILETNIETKNELWEREYQWLQLINEEDLKIDYYNCHREKHLGGDTFKGKRHSDDSKRKMSKAKKGRKTGPMSEERKKAISESKRRKPHVYTEDQKRRMSEKRKEYISNNYDKIVEINREITSRPEWREQRSMKQKELHTIPGYTAKRIDAMSRVKIG